MNILFICTGNTCRSPMAEVIYASLTDKKYSRSAGFIGSGNPASQEAQQVALERGLNLQHHQSQIVNDKLVEWSDLILCMSENHRQLVLRQYPNKKTFTLYDFALGVKKDIDDPFGLDISIYREVFQELEMLIKRIYNKKGVRI